jgi:6,7-dimethyl-8-ribityllumazine synthase
MIKKLQPTTTIDKTFAKKLRIAIVRPDYYPELNSNLERYCVDTLVTNYVPKSQIKTFVVPGSWEVPLMVQRIAESKKFDAIVAFGIVLKGETYHFEMIANEVGRALMQLSVDYSLPIALEVLAVFDLKQAQARAGDNNHNRGIEAATAVLKMLKALENV